MPSGYVGMGRETAIGEVTNPFAIVIGMGFMVWAVSALGVVGGLCSKRLDSTSEFTYMRRWGTRFLLTYYILLLGICAGLLYAMFLCFLFSDKVHPKNSVLLLCTPTNSGFVCLQQNKKALIDLPCPAPMVCSLLESVSRNVPGNTNPQCFDLGN